MNKTTKSILFVLMLVSLVILAIMGWHWTDLAKTPFWWTFWVVAAIAAIPAFILVLKWFDKSRKQW